MDIGKIDRAMDYEIRSAEGMDWYDADHPVFALDGLYWRKKGEVFRRIPENVFISEGVESLARHTAGVMLRFCSDASEIRINAKLWHNSRMAHMASTGSMGFDLYIGSPFHKTFARSLKFDRDKDEYLLTIFGPDQPQQMREFTLNFPLYSGVASLELGFSAGAVVREPSAYQTDAPVVVYGTSIQQGGCASRPGMCHTNIMSRMLNRKFLNFGFSGNGKGEAAMAELLASIKDPAMYILDYDANALTDGLRKTLHPFVEILRKAHPETPILLVSRLPYADEINDSQIHNAERDEFTSIHLDELNYRREAGDRNIHFLDGSSLYGTDPAECTVDGVHATDLGFYQIARHMAPVIERILSKKQ